MSATIEVGQPRCEDHASLRGRRFLGRMSRKQRRADKRVETICSNDMAHGSSEGTTIPECYRAAAVAAIALEMPPCVPNDDPAPGWHRELAGTAPNFHVLYHHADTGSCLASEPQVKAYLAESSTPEVSDFSFAGPTSSNHNRLFQACPKLPKLCHLDSYWHDNICVQGTSCADQVENILAKYHGRPDLIRTGRFLARLWFDSKSTHTSLLPAYVVARSNSDAKFSTMPLISRLPAQRRRDATKKSHNVATPPRYPHHGAKRARVHPPETPQPLWTSEISKRSDNSPASDVDDDASCASIASASEAWERDSVASAQGSTSSTLISNWPSHQFQGKVSSTVSSVPPLCDLVEDQLPYASLINFPRAKRGEPLRCVMCGRLSKQREAGRYNSCARLDMVVIPCQNKAVCRDCDRAIWRHNASNSHVKWCKGCKRFENLLHFSEKLRASKCNRCRERARLHYARRRNRAGSSLATSHSHTNDYGRPNSAS